MSNYEIASVILSSITLFILCIYTYHTYQMAKVAKENIELTKKIQSESSFPIISLMLHRSDVIKWNMGSLETRFQLRNTTKFDAKVWVTMEVRIDGKVFDWDTITERKYSGIEPWPVPAFATVTGHFDFGRIMNVVEARKSMIPLEALGEPFEIKDRLYIVLKYRWSDLHETHLEGGMEQKWYYNFAKNAWVFDI